MKHWKVKLAVAGAPLAYAVLGAPVAGAEPVGPVDPGVTGGIYGETSPYSGGPNPWATAPVPGIVPGMVPGSNAPLASELNTGTSGIRPGTNALVPGSLAHNPAPDFPDNHFAAPAEGLPGQPLQQQAVVKPAAPDHQWGPLAHGGDSNPDDPDNPESAPDQSMARQLEPDAGDEDTPPTGDTSKARELDPGDDQ